MGLSDPRSDSFVIIALQTLKQIVKDQPSRYARFNEILTNRQTCDTKKPTKYISAGVMKQKYDHKFLYFILIYILNYALIQWDSVSQWLTLLILFPYRQIK